MPIYEYRCEPCDHSFETLVRGQNDVPRCPECGRIELEKQFSVPAAAADMSTKAQYLRSGAGGRRFRPVTMAAIT